MNWASTQTVQAVILQQAEQYDSFYLYDAAHIKAASQRLQLAFPKINFLYSLKNNPCKQIAKILFDAGFGVDAASLGEVFQSVAQGVPKEKIQYSAPGKTDKDIIAALPHATIIADSLGEVMRIQEIAAIQQTIANIGIRIHPQFAFDEQGYAPSKFGIEEAQAFRAIPTWLDLSNIRIVGLHIHCRSQSLSEPALQRYHQNVFACAKRFQAALSYSLDFLNMGAGLGIPYAPEDTPLNLANIATITQSAMEDFHQTHPTTHVFIETGRYCVGNHGIYASKVLDKKTCNGKTFVILANTLNGFVRPCLANFVEANCETPTVAEPLYTGKNAFDILPVLQHNHAPENETSASQKTTSSNETVTLVGNLCTAADTLAKDIYLPTLHRGDMIVQTNAGSYAAVLSPLQFSQQIPPAQRLLCQDGTVIDANA